MKTISPHGEVEANSMIQSKTAPSETIRCSEQIDYPRVYSPDHGICYPKQPTLLTFPPVCYQGIRSGLICLVRRVRKVCCAITMHCIDSDTSDLKSNRAVAHLQTFRHCKGRFFFYQLRCKVKSLG